jgi:hypothetical protein
MVSIDDWVFNQKTGQFGRVIGYGHQMLNSVYQTTLKVKVANSASIVEDVIAAWTLKDQAVAS